MNEPTETEPTAEPTSESPPAPSLTHAPCPPTGGATSTRQMTSTITAVLTDYQYWHFKLHGHGTTLA
jgi:hypothetical protein